METFKILKINGTIRESSERLVVAEVPITITANGKELVTLLSTPLNLDDLTIGFLFSSGLIHKKEEIKKLVIDRQRWNVTVELDNDLDIENMIFKRMYTSGCGKGTLFYNAADIANRRPLNANLEIKSSQITSLMSLFLKSAPIYLETGGTHSAAIANNDKIEIFREDIGRHNAIDKVIGAGLMGDYDLKNKILISSGRISSEVIFKMQKANLAIILSKSAPTDQAVKHARKMNITIVAFVRGNRMNVYSGEKRIEI
ncbi:MAG: formate dehydrogenase accessory sulfurtransferase FdhD [Candidatus Omnitrophica bacterium]|nr:formate dehydrogenase accessory sulfurtransferase FdhD [Candidatus Omnitrophota bacterium]